MGLLGVAIGASLLTPKQAPGNPQASPSVHRTNDSEIIQLDCRLDDVTSIKNSTWRLILPIAIKIYIRHYIVAATYNFNNEQKINLLFD